MYLLLIVTKSKHTKIILNKKIMPYTRVLPEVTISELTPRKRRFFLKHLARFLLMFESVKAKGSFLDNKRVIITAAPHQSGKDEYLMILMMIFQSHYLKRIFLTCLSLRIGRKMTEFLYLIMIDLTLRKMISR